MQDSCSTLRICYILDYLEIVVDLTFQFVLICNCFEELDMTSSFVSKAALIAKRQLEQNPRAEKKKNPDKERPKNAAAEELKVPHINTFPLVAHFPGFVIVFGLFDTFFLSVQDCSSSLEDNVKISTEFASKSPLNQASSLHMQTMKSGICTIFSLQF